MKSFVTMLFRLGYVRYTIKIGKRYSQFKSGPYDKTKINNMALNSVLASPELSSRLLNVVPRMFFVCLFCCFMSQVNSYGHRGTVSSPNHTFSRWGMKPPTPNPPPRTPHGNCRMISRNNLSMNINKLAFKRSMISISKYPESFVKIEFVDLKKINNYCIVWV